MHGSRTVFFSLLLAFVLTSSAFAREPAGTIDIDLSLSYATGPGVFNSGPGLNIGAGYTLSFLSGNLQFRVDASAYDFEGYYWGMRYERVSVTAGARYYFPITDRTRAFVQAGLETSKDSKDTYVLIDMMVEENKRSTGFSPGAGGEFTLNRNLGIFLLGRYHGVTDGYSSLHFGTVAHF